MKKVLLLSGGLDSLYLYFTKALSIGECIYFDYGQYFKEQELKVLDALEIDYKVVKINDLSEDEDGFWYGRNLSFMLKVREMYDGENVAVYFGSTIEDFYEDNTRKYLNYTEYIIDRGFKGKFKIITPLVNMTKEEISVEMEDFLEDTGVKPYWCMRGEDEPCGECKCCMDMKQSGIYNLWVKDK